MNVFSYKAVNKSGDKKTGIVLAENCEKAFEDIQAKNLIPIKISKIRSANSKIPLKDMLMFFLHLDFQLKCGMTIDKAIKNFIESHGNQVLNVKLLQVSQLLQDGHSISTAFNHSSFDKIIIGLLSAAEKTGNLSEVISNILEFLKLKEQWRTKVKSVLAYPLFLTGVAIAVMSFCICFLGPQVLVLLNSQYNHQIPFLTDFAINYLPQTIGIILSFAIIGIFVFFSLYKTNPQVKNTILFFPKLGRIIQQVSIWQFCKILQIALSSKLEFIKALDLGIDSVEFDCIKKDLEQVRMRTLCGYKIFQAMSLSKFFDKSVLIAIYIGEEGNNLEKSLEHVSDELYKDILFKLKSFGRSLSVGLTLMTGGIFVFILYSLFFPLYDYMEVVSQ